MKDIYQKNKGKFIWIILGTIALLVRVLLSYFPAATEMIYSRGIFMGIRVFLDYTIGWLPIPVVQLLIVALVVFLFYKIRNLYHTHRSFLDSLKRVTLGLVSFLFAVVFFFLVLWGYNYCRIPIHESLNIEPKPLSMDELKIELFTTTEQVKISRSSIQNATNIALNADFLPKNLEEKVRQDVEDLLGKLGYPTVGEVRGRLLRPKGILLRFSTAGVYFPWTGESNIDAGLHPIQIPFTLAHEFAHGYGFTDEGTCNFLAYLACNQSKNPIIKYSGQLGYWRYVASAYRRMDKQNYSDFFKTLPKGMIADLYAIDENSDKYPDIMPKFRDATYDAFLKYQGVKEGLKSYSQVVMMVKSWREKE